MAKKFSKIDISEKDPFEDIRNSASNTETKVNALKIALEAINEGIKEIKKDASTIKGGLFKTDPTDAKNQKELNNNLKEANKLVQQNQTYTRAKTQATKALSIEEAKLKEELRKANLESRQVARLKLAEKGSVDALRARLNILTREWDKLTTAERNNSDRGKRLKDRIDQTTIAVTKLEQSTNRHQRNVGNYGSALDGLKTKFRGLTNVAGQFGLALGGVALVRGAITTIAEFETQVADLSAVTGQTGKDLDFLKEKAIDFSKRYGESAASIATAFKLAGSARPELLKNGAAMADLTEKAIILSKASGDDVPTSIKNLTGTLNAFELPASEAGKVMDILANAAQLGSQEIPYLTDAFTKFGAIAKSSNIDVAESAAAIEILGQKMPDAASAGTGLRNVMLKLMAPDALGKDAQDRLKALGVNFDDLKDKSKPFADRLDALKPLLTDSTALVKVFGTENAVAAQILLSQTDQLREFTSGLDKNGTALGQAETKSKTLAEAGARLKANIEGLVLEMLNGVNASSGLASALDFLANNLESIVYWIGKGIQVFVTYKAAMMALNMKDRITEFIKFKDTAKDASGALTAGESGAKKFGAALKGIGFAVLITAAIELGTALYRIASGAAEAEKRINSMNRGRAKGADIATKDIDRLKEQVALGNITQAQMDEEIKKKIRALNVIRDTALAEQKAFEKSKEFRDANAKNAALRNSDDLMIIAKSIDKREQVTKLNAALTEYNGLLKEQEINAYQATIAEKEAVIVSGQTAKETKVKTEVIEEFNAALLDSELLLEDFGKSYQELIREVLDGWDEIRDLSNELNNDMANDNTIVDVSPEVFTDAELKSLGVITDAQKKKFEETKKWGDLTNQYLQRVLDERIEKLDAEIEASKKYYDSIQAQADAGIGNAQQSQAKEAQIQEEKQAKKEKLEKRKAQFAATAAFLNTYLSEREAGKSATEAFTAATLDKVTIESLIGALPTFLEGTENTGKGGNLDKDGGFLSILHPEERVITKEQNKVIGNMTNAELVSTVQMAKLSELKGNIAPSGWNNTGLLTELNGLKSEMQEVRKAIIDKPVSSIELGKITQKTMEIVHSTKAGNRTTQSTYIVK